MGTDTLVTLTGAPVPLFPVVRQCPSGFRPRTSVRLVVVDVGEAQLGGRPLMGCAV